MSKVDDHVKSAAQRKKQAEDLAKQLLLLQRGQSLSLTVERKHSKSKEATAFSVCFVDDGGDLIIDTQRIHREEISAFMRFLLDAYGPPA